MDKKVLLIDDEEPQLDVLEMMLGDWRIPHLRGKNGTTGLKQFTKHQGAIGLVILDYIMPGRDGEEVFMEMRKIDPNVPVVMLSGFSVEPQERLMREGLAGFYRKPIQKHILRGIIDRHYAGLVSK